MCYDHLQFVFPSCTSRENTVGSSGPCNSNDACCLNTECFRECEYEYEYEYLRGDVLVAYCEDVCDCTAIGRDQCTVTWYTCYLIEWTFQINENNSTGRIYDNSDQKHCRYSSATTCKNEYETRFAVNNQVQ